MRVQLQLPYLATQTECIAIMRVLECISRRDAIIFFFFLTHIIFRLGSWYLHTIVHYMTVKLWHFILFGAAAVTHWTRDFRIFAITLGYDLWTSTHIFLDNARSLESRHSNVIAKTKKIGLKLNSHWTHETPLPHKSFHTSPKVLHSMFMMHGIRQTERWKKVT